MTEYKAVVDFAMWPQEDREGNQPHFRSGKIEISNSLLREMTDAKKRGEDVVLQVAGWKNKTKKGDKDYMGCKLSVNGYLMNKVVAEGGSNSESKPKEEGSGETEEKGSIFD